MKLFGWDDVHDLSYGKFDSPMAKFLYYRVLLEGDYGDGDYSDGEGTWGNRYGRRVLEGDDQGFIYYTKFDTEGEATDAFERIRELYEYDDGGIDEYLDVE